MAFVVPAMPLLCDIYSAGDYGVNPPRVAGVPCNLSQGRRALQGTLLNATDASFFGQAILLVPAATDIRGLENGLGSPDVVDCPAGTGRPYVVFRVDDMGRGFPNEHRFAMIAIIPDAYPWPSPVP